MTLVGLLPPLCDNGQLLVDGGYSEYVLASLVAVELNSFRSRQLACRSGTYVTLIPTDHVQVQAMFSMGANTVFACDVGSVRVSSTDASVTLIQLSVVLD
jgi:lysophospholipid hydrolase